MKSKGIKVFSLVLIAVSAATIVSAPPASASNKRAVPAELYRFVLEAQLKVQEADKKMIDCMGLLGDLTKEYFQRYGRFPSSAADLARYAPEENILRRRNPYLEHEYLKRELPVDTSPVIKIEIVEDYGISKNGITEMLKQPPQNWDGEPGTIVIMHNSENAFGIRGCGLTRKPIRDSTTSSAAIIFRNFN